MIRVTMLRLICFLAVSCGWVEAGDLVGTVHFNGTPPVMPEIKTSADAQCSSMDGTPMRSEEVVVNKNHTLKNVFVYIKDGINRVYPPPSTPIELNQKGCRYTPHVFGIQTGQPLVIVNSDPTLHNVHATPTENPTFNLAEPIKGMRLTRTFQKPEVMVKFRCEVHNWMTAYCGILTHPFYAVTGSDGTFHIKGVPPGTYTLEAWQEKYGTKSVRLTVTGTETRQDFTYAAP